MSNFELKKREKFVSNLNNVLNGDNIYIWGGGKHTIDLLEIISESKLITNIKGIIDSDKSKEGQNIKGILIQHKSSFFKGMHKSCSDIIISSTYEDDIYNEIRAILDTDVNLIKLHNKDLWYVIFGNPCGSKEWFEEQFEAVDELGDKWGQRWRASQKVRYEIYLNIIKLYLKNVKYKILDIGCALGDFTEKVYNLNKDNDITAIDISENAINQNRKIYSNIKFEIGSIPILNYEESSFDFIMCLEVLCYLNNKERIEALKNIKKVLRKKGKVFVSVGINRGDTDFEEQDVLKLISREFRILKVQYNYGYLYYKIEARFLEIVKNYDKNSLKYKAAFLFLSWNWIVKIFKIVSKLFYNDKAKTHIIILAERND